MRFGVEYADHAFVAGEQPGHAARGRGIDREQRAGDVDHALQAARARHVQPVIILRREIEIREAAVTEPVRQRGIACEQLGRGKTMPLRLQDMMIVDRAELADGTVHRRDEIGIGQRPYARFQRPPEKVVERGVTGDVRVFGLAHVDTVFPDEPADQPGRRPPPLRPRNATGKLGEPTFGQKVLRQDRQATEHHDL